jgi:hypothetical protein
MEKAEKEEEDSGGVGALKRRQHTVSPSDSIVTP